MLPFTSIDAATATGPGVSKDLEEVLGQHTMFVHVTGLPATQIAVDLEGSHDGSTWLGLATASWSSGQTGDNNLVSTQRSVRFVRANLRILSGGTSPTVTATIASS